jgi:hypothetical protein
MATYTELLTLSELSSLQDKVAVAVAIKAQALLVAATPSAAEVTWAEAAIATPKGKVPQMLNFFLAANKGATVQQITDSTDTAIQTNVDTAADVIISGGV